MESQYQESPITMSSGHYGPDAFYAQRQETEEDNDAVPSSPNDGHSRPSQKRRSRRRSSFRVVVPDAQATETARDDASKETRIIIAIDYGTTNSGIAWAQVEAGKTPSIDNILSFRDWNARTDDKVPSVISFSKYTEGKSQYGYDIAQGSVTLQWNKLELKDPSNRTEELALFRRALEDLRYLEEARNPALTDDESFDIDIPNHVGLDSEEIVMEYMQRLSNHFFQTVGDQRGEALLKVNSVDVVITHPPYSFKGTNDKLWSYSALNKTVKAIRAAFGPQNLPKINNYTLCPEPEAAAIYNICRAGLSRKPRAGQSFIVADAGGGTVDLASFKVTGYEPTTTIERVGPLTGRLCGAVFVDQAFFRWLQRDVMDDLGVNVDGIGSGGKNCFPPTALAIHDSFQIIKSRFSGDETQDIIPLDLPEGISVKEPRPTATVGNQTIELVVGESLQIPREQLKQLFDSSVKGIVALLRAHYQLLHRKHQDFGRVSHIFLAGGLSKNLYVQKKVREWAQGEQPDLQVVVATGDDDEHSWNAVAMGAVMREAGIAGRRSDPLMFFPKSLGFKLVNDRTSLGPRRNAWLMKKGDIIIPGERIVRKHPFEIRAPAKGIITLSFDILVSDLPTPPLTGTEDQVVINQKIKFYDGYDKTHTVQTKRWEAAVEFSYESGDKIEVRVLPDMDSDVHVWKGTVDWNKSTS